MAAFYLPIHEAPYSPSEPGQWVGETPLLERKAIAKNIFDGDISPPERILEIDADSGTAKDVTREIAADVGALSFEPNPYCEEPYADLAKWLGLHRAEYYERGDAPSHRVQMQRDHGMNCRARLL